MEEHKITDSILAHKFLIILFMLATMAIFLASRYSFLSIEVAGANTPDRQFTYRLLDQKSRKTTEVNSASPRIRRLMPKGDYEVLVSQNSKSFFSLAKIGGFFTQTKVRANLSPEKDRSFIGNNPESCMYLREKLYSYECSGLLSSIRSHEPATAELPTHKTKVITAVEGTIEGILGVNNSTIAVVRSSGDDSAAPKHIGYTLGDGLKLAEDAVLSSLDDKKIYSAQPYKEGFLIYDESFNEVRYFQSIKSQPEEIVLAKPSDSNLKPFLLSTRNDSVATLYSSSTEGEDPDNPDRTGVKNEVVVYGQGKSQRFKFDGQSYSSFSLCGEKSLCLLGERQLFVYDIGSKEPRYLFKVNGVNTLDSSGSSLLVVRDKEVLNINPSSGIGFIDYSFGNYGYCGIQTSTSNYVVCLINASDEKVAIRIDNSLIDSDNIDKKIQVLQGLSEISDLSVYDKFIYISPVLGPIAYDFATRGFGYNSETKKRVSARINEEINKLGIDRGKYTIINTLQ